MKTIKAKIIEDSYLKNNPEECFLFPSEEDKKALFSFIPDLSFLLFTYQGVTKVAAHKAWDVLRKNGWIHDGFDKNRYIIWHLPETDLESLELELKYHDWYFDYSDDFREWNTGQSTLTRIKTLMSKINSLEAQALWDQYCPFNKKEEK